jgi:hypothetical protein
MGQSSLMAIVMLHHNPHQATLKSCVALIAKNVHHGGLWYPSSVSAQQRLTAYSTAIQIRKIREDHERRGLVPGAGFEPAAPFGTRS